MQLELWTVERRLWTQELLNMEMSVGEQLQRARSELRLSLKEAASATKIQPWVLEALERNQLHLTMNPVYTKGFLSTYAKHLRLDPASLIAQLLPQASPEPSSAPTTSEAQDVLWTWIRDSSWPFLRRLGSLAAGVAVMALVLANHPWRHRSATAKHKEASISAVPKLRTPPIEPAVRVEPIRLLELAVVAHQPTWVSVKSDGALIAHQQLKSGSQKLWKAGRSLEVVIGSPAKVDVSLNGKPINPLVMAHQGRLLITHRGITPLDESDAASASSSDVAQYETTNAR